MTLLLRDEREGDEAAIEHVVTRAFAGLPHSDGSEAQIVGGLRSAGALALSLLAELDEETVGYVAFSPVTIDGNDVGWLGLGPVAVRPDLQGQGIGTALIQLGLGRLRSSGAKGCVVLGEPAYYGRFNFRNDPTLKYPGPPAEYFLRIRFSDSSPTGIVRYHPAFG